MTATRIWLAFMAATVTLACGDEGRARADVSVPQLHAVEDLRIGSVEGDGPDVFGWISGIAVDDAGRILVADMQANEVRVFDAEGAFRFRIGRHGGGPGEFSSPCCLAIAPDGRLWVRDNGNARYVAFEIDADGATAVRTIRMQHSDANRHVATTFDDAGRLIDIGSRPDPLTGTPRTIRFHMMSDGTPAQEVVAPAAPNPDALVHRVPVQTGNATFVRFFHQPFGPRHLLAHGPEGAIADAVSSAYEVRWHAADGSLLHVIARPDVVGPSLTPEQRQRGDSLIASFAAAAGGPMPFTLPDRQPPIGALRFDASGRLWVQRTAPPGEPRPVDIYDRDGRLAAQLELPAGLDLEYGVVRPDLLVGVSRDELGVDYLVRLRLTQWLSASAPI
jgi:hypothetical protein